MARTAMDRLMAAREGRFRFQLVKTDEYGGKWHEVSFAGSSATQVERIRLGETTNLRAALTAMGTTCSDIQLASKPEIFWALVNIWNEAGTLGDSRDGFDALFWDARVRELVGDGDSDPENMGAEDWDNDDLSIVSVDVDDQLEYFPEQELAPVSRPGIAATVSVAPTLLPVSKSPAAPAVPAASRTVPTFSAAHTVPANASWDEDADSDSDEFDDAAPIRPRPQSDMSWIAVGAIVTSTLASVVDAVVDQICPENFSPTEADTLVRSPFARAYTTQELFETEFDGVQPEEEASCVEATATENTLSAHSTPPNSSTIFLPDSSSFITIPPDIASRALFQNDPDELVPEDIVAASLRRPASWAGPTSGEFFADDCDTQNELSEPTTPRSATVKETKRRIPWTRPSSWPAAELATGEAVQCALCQKRFPSGEALKCHVKTHKAPVVNQMEDDSDEEASPLERGDRNDEMSIFARFFL